MSTSEILEYKDWDSDFFKQTIYDVPVQCIPNLNEETFRFVKEALIQIKVASHCIQDMDLLQRLGFFFVESELCFTSDCTEKRESTSDLTKVQVAVVDDIPQIEAVAFDSFAYSRFRHPWFKITDSSRFYAEWARKAVLNEYDDVCLKIGNTLDNSICGIVTGKRLSQSDARIGLICTSEQYRGKNIGSELLTAIEDWCFAQGIKKIHVSTQGSNFRACSFYLRHRYQLNAINYWLYKRVS